MSSSASAATDYPWGDAANYWGWVDRRSVRKYDCPFCGQPKGQQCVTTNSRGIPELVGSYPLSKPHAGRRAPVEAEAAEIRIGRRG